MKTLLAVAALASMLSGCASIRHRMASDHEINCIYNAVAQRAGGKITLDQEVFLAKGCQDVFEMEVSR